MLDLGVDGDVWKEINAWGFSIAYHLERIKKG